MGFLPAPNARGSAGCGRAKLDPLTKAFASKVWLKIAAVASRLQRIVGRLLRTEITPEFTSCAALQLNKLKLI